MTIAFRSMILRLPSPMIRWLFVTLGFLAATFATAAPIKRIWLSHEEETPATLTISWETDEPSPAVVG